VPQPGTSGATHRVPRFLRIDGNAGASGGPSCSRKVIHHATKATKSRCPNLAQRNIKRLTEA